MPLSLHAPLPDLGEAKVWINGRATRDSLLGKPVLVHFWSVSCGLCKEGLRLLDFLRSVGGSTIGLELIGIHTPRLPSDADVGRVASAVAEFGLAHPVLADHDGTFAEAYRNEFVPAYYLFDKNHRLCHYQAGEHALRAVERHLGQMAAGQ